MQLIKAFQSAVTPSKVRKLESAILLSGKPVLRACDYKTEHKFADGLYCRRITIPADTLMTSQHHRFSHIATIISGEVEVRSETETIRYKGGDTFVTPAGTKRALYTITDTVWQTVHNVPVGCTDVGVIGDLIIINKEHI